MCLEMAGPHFMSCVLLRFVPRIRLGLSIAGIRRRRLRRWVDDDYALGFGLMTNSYTFDDGRMAFLTGLRSSSIHLSSSECMALTCCHQFLCVVPRSLDVTTAYCITPPYASPSVVFCVAFLPAINSATPDGDFSLSIFCRRRCRRKPTP